MAKRPRVTAGHAKQRQLRTAGDAASRSKVLTLNGGMAVPDLSGTRHYAPLPNASDIVLYRPQAPGIVCCAILIVHRKRDELNPPEQIQDDCTKSGTGTKMPDRAEVQIR
jgi:hypothetical protein